MILSGRNCLKFIGLAAALVLFDDSIIANMCRMFSFAGEIVIKFPGIPALLQFVLYALFVHIVQSINQFSFLLQIILYVFFIISAFNPEKYSRTVFSGLVFISFLIDYAFRSVTGEAVSLSDMDMMIENVSFTGRSIGMFSSSVMLAALKAAVVAFFYWLPPQAEKYKKIEVVAYYLPFLFAIPLINMGVKDFDEFSCVIPAVPRIAVYSGISVFSPMRYGIGSEVVLPLKEKGKIRNIVLVIDESVSSDFVNAENKLDLLLFRDYGKYMIDFSPAHSAGNCTRASRSYLRFAVDPENLKAKGIRVLDMPNIWAYAKKAGYQTYLIGYSPINTDYLSHNEIGMIDHYIGMGDSEYGTGLDIELGKIVKEKILSDDNYKLMIVTKFGSHFSYDNDYPKDKKVYAPTVFDGGEFTKEKLLNSYKNALKWTTDGFFGSLFEKNKLDLKDTVIIYTSDHGQNLTSYQDFILKIPNTHCSPANPPDKEFAVPLLLLTDNDDIKKRIGSSRGGQASHFNIVPTVLDLMGYEKTKTESLFSDDLKCYPAFYNDPYGRFGKLKVKEFDCK